MQESIQRHVFFCFRRRIETAQRQDAASALLNLAQPMEVDGSAPQAEDMEHVLEDIAAQFEHLNMTTRPTRTDSNTSSKPTQTDMKADDIADLENQVRIDQEEIGKLKAKVGKLSLSEDDFRDNDKKVKCYTSLPSFAVLMVIINFLMPFLKKDSVLTPFCQVLLTIMRMRFNLGTQYLSYVFGVGQTTVRRIFDHTLDVMFYKLVPTLVFWPDRAELRQTLPTSFRMNFSKCACIIDCFEIFIETCSNLLAKAQTYSNYKHHNTIKYLIGISPQGSVIFISKGYGGRASDKFVTEHSGFLAKLLPGDLVLADRGFDIEEMVEAVLALLGIPAFTKGKTQLEPIELELTRKLANSRIHVERVIGNVRCKFLILEGTVMLCMLEADDQGFTQLDKIVAVCCALTNCSPSIVPFD